MKFQTNEPPRREIEIAPLLDIIFLLLIFFMVTASYAEQEQSADIKVPTSEQGVDRPRAYSEIIINVLESGECVVQGNQMTQVQLLQKLNNLTLAGQDAKNQPVRIRGDANTRYEDIIKIIDICKKAGIWNISFAVRTEKS